MVGMLVVLDASTTEPMRKGSKLSLTDCIMSLQWHGVDSAEYLSSHAGYMIIHSFRLENLNVLQHHQVQNDLQDQVQPLTEHHYVTKLKH